MKQYVKPKAEFSICLAANRLASLNEWLSKNELGNAGITTYYVSS